MERRTSEHFPICASSVFGEQARTSGGPGMTLAPGMEADTAHGEQGWKRNVKTGLRLLREEYGANTPVPVMEEHRCNNFEIAELFEGDLVEGTGGTLSRELVQRTGSGETLLRAV